MTNKKELTPVQQVGQALAQMEPQLKAALPSSIPSARFLRTAQMAIQTPEIVKALQEGAEKSSLYQSVSKCAQDGLVMDNREAALVVFNTKQGNGWVKKFQYMPMVAGILKKAFNTGEIESISAHVVYKEDDFSYELGDNEHIRHIPSDLDDPGPIVRVYAIGKLKSGGVQRVVMNKRQVDKHRDVAKTDYIWNAWEEEMWEKTALKKLMKRMPQSSELERLFRQDDELINLEPSEYQEVDVTETVEQTETAEQKPKKEEPKKTTKAAAAVKGKAKPEPKEEDPLGDEPPASLYDDIAEGEFTDVGEEQQDLI